jgi:hypothetical protein
MKEILKIFKYWKYGLAIASPFLTYAAYKLDMKEPKIKKIPLDIETANYRAEKIHDIKYMLNLNFKHSEKNNFKGKISIDFSLSSTKDIFLEFDGKIVDLKLNNYTQSTFFKKNNRIYLNENYLKSQNNIIIEFETKFKDTKSKGLIKCVNFFYFLASLDIFLY